MRTHSKCICGSETHAEFHDYIKEINEQKIIICNVPYFPCQCGYAWYDLSEPISSCLVFAYKNGYTNVEYEEIKEIYLKSKE